MSLRAQAAARKRIAELERQVRRMIAAASYPAGYGGVTITTGKVCDVATSAVRTARRLGFTPIVDILDDGSLRVQAIKLEEAGK